MDKVNEDKNRFGITSFVLHIIAMAAMLCDHLWGTFFVNSDLFGYVGRIAFPIFAFLIVEGYFHTKSIKDYMIRLWIFAMISEIPFNLMMAHDFIYPFHHNVLWTFLLSLIAIIFMEKTKHKHIVFRLIVYPIVIVVFYLLGMVTFVDYNGYGVLMVILFYFTRIKPEDSTVKKAVLLIIQVIGMYIINVEMMKGLMLIVDIGGSSFEFAKQGLALFALPFIWLYNGKQGYYNKYVKYFYYAFYPVHMFILGLWIYLL